MKIVYAYFDGEECFYIGIGNPGRERRHTKDRRNKFCYSRIAKAKNANTFSIKILHSGLTLEEACKIEIEYISSIGRADQGKGSLTNLTDGGECSTGYKHTMKTKKILKEKRSKRETEPRLGKSHSEDSKRKISEKLKGRKLNIDRINNSVENNSRVQKVQTPLGTFRSATKAADAHGVSFTTILRWCNNKRKPDFKRGQDNF